MRDFLKGIAGAFVEFDDKTPPTAANAGTADSNKTLPVSSPAATRTVVTAVSGAADEETQRNIMADVDADTPAELVEFYSLVDSFNNLPTDEMRYQTARIAFEKQKGRNVASLFAGMAVRKKAIENVVSSYTTALKADKAKVDATRKQAEQLDVKMQELSEKIVQLKSDKSKLLGDAATSEQDLANAQAVFLASADAVRAVLNEQEENLTRYIGAADTTSTTTTRKVRK